MRRVLKPGGRFFFEWATTSFLRLPYPLVTEAPWQGVPGQSGPELPEVPRRIRPLLVSDEDQSDDPHQLPGAGAVPLRDRDAEEARVPKPGWVVAGGIQAWTQNPAL